MRLAPVVGAAAVLPGLEVRHGVPYRRGAMVQAHRGQPLMQAKRLGMFPSSITAVKGGRRWWSMDWCWAWVRRTHKPVLRRSCVRWLEPTSVSQAHTTPRSFLFFDMPDKNRVSNIGNRFINVEPSVACLGFFS